MRSEAEELVKKQSNLIGDYPLNWHCKCGKQNPRWTLKDDDKPNTEYVCSCGETQHSPYSYFKVFGNSWLPSISKEKALEVVSLARKEEQEGFRYSVRDRDRITAKKIFEEIEKLIWNRGKDHVANIRYTAFIKTKNRFLPKPQSGKGDGGK